MKRLALAALLAASAACGVESRDRSPPPTDFYGELAPYGSWVTLEPYGSVWRPSPAVVGADFYPYCTGGWWVSTVPGWSWHSTWKWGWIPFHHGRWVESRPYGWVWVPGDAWAPAWVEWRVGSGNVGWVPLAPAAPSDHSPRWVFVPLSYLPRHDFQAARLPAYQEYAAYHAATSIPFERAGSKRGPSVELIRRAGGRVDASSEPPPRRLRAGDVRAERRLAAGSLPASASSGGGTQPMPPPPTAPAPPNDKARKHPPPS
jgi:hypothetical protein